MELADSQKVLDESGLQAHPQFSFLWGVCRSDSKSNPPALEPKLQPILRLSGPAGSPNSRWQWSQRLSEPSDQRERTVGSRRSNLATWEPPARFEHCVTIPLLVPYRTALSDLLNQALSLPLVV
jgi:hypothetical protein